MKLLLIAPIFFDYEKAIKKTLEADVNYEKVIFRNEIPFNSPVRYYALRRISPALAEKALKRYNKSLISLVNAEKIDRILIIRGCGLLPKFFEQIRQLNRNIEIINYQWDSIQNNPNGLVISRYTSLNYSFDLKDAHAYEQFKHVPLFYTWESVPICKNPQQIEQNIDLLFVGGYHSQRHILVAQAKKELEDKGYIIYSHIYMPIWIYIKKKLWGEKIRRSDVSFRKINRTEYHSLLCRSKAMLDIQSSTQTGATIRSIETLSLGRKLVSTNAWLREEQFFSETNILIWDIHQSCDISHLISTPFERRPDKEVLTLREWLSKIGL